MAAQCLRLLLPCLRRAYLLGTHRAKLYKWLEVDGLTGGEKTQGDWRWVGQGRTRTFYSYLSF